MTLQIILMGDSDNEITVEEQEWAVAMANENILGSNFNKDILLLDTVKRLQKQNKQAICSKNKRQTMTPYQIILKKKKI